MSKFAQLLFSAVVSMRFHPRNISADVSDERILEEAILSMRIVAILLQVMGDQE